MKVTDICVCAREGFLATATSETLFCPEGGGGQEETKKIYSLYTRRCMTPSSVGASV